MKCFSPSTAYSISGKCGLVKKEKSWGACYVFFFLRERGACYVLFFFWERGAWYVAKGSLHHFSFFKSNLLILTLYIQSKYSKDVGQS